MTYTTTPQTSVDAYHQIVSEGLLSRARMRVYRVVHDHGPITRAEIVKRLETPNTERQPDIYNRLSDLRSYGVLDVDGERKCAVTGRRCQTWVHTGQLPKKPVKKNEPTRYELLQRIDELELENKKLRARLRKPPQLSLFGNA